MQCPLVFPRIYLAKVTSGDGALLRVLALCVNPSQQFLTDQSHPDREDLAWLDRQYIRRTHSLLTVFTISLSSGLTR
jgi:hypothetical protein